MNGLRTLILALIAATATAVVAVIFWQGWPSISTTWRAVPTLERQAYSAVGGGAAAPQCCGDCNGDGTVTVDEILKIINSALTTCEGGGGCSPGGLPASGQTTAYGPGSDGDTRAGAALSYTDNGDGTITDKNTGLMWEKKDDSSGIHGKNNTYTWGTHDMDGTLVTQFLATLNQAPCFAGHCDWRIPNIKELQSIVDYEVSPPGPVVDPAFYNATGCAGCTDVTVASCSCTAVNFYWSSTTSQGAGDPQAWSVNFLNGAMFATLKNSPSPIAARAVRG